MIKTSKPFTVPKAPEILYRNELYKMIKAMIKDYKSVLGIYRDKQEQVAMDAEGTWLTTDINKKLDSLGRKWGKNFEIFAKEHSKKFVEKMLRLSNTQIKQVLKDWFADQRLELIGQVVPEQIKQVVNANIAYNVSLIKSIAPQYHDRVLGSVMRSINGGGSLKQLSIEIARYGGMEMRRAKLIAQDQTRKVYNSITMRNCQRLGVQKMKFNHSHAVREARPLHIRKWDGVSGLKDGRPNGLDGFIFSIDNPPVIQEAKGKQPEIRGYPAQLPFCYHKDTEVYTERGFVPIKNVVVGEKVLTLDPYNKQLEWSVCNGKTSKYVEKIAHLKGQRFDLSVDINHRFFLYRPYYGNGKRILSMKPDFVDGVYNIPKKASFYGGAEWKGVSKEYVEIENLQIPIDDYLRFMGYYLSEGSIDNRSSRISISQYIHKEEMFNNLKFFLPHKVKQGIYIYNEKIRRYLIQFGKASDKYIPEIIKELPKEKIRIFLDAFALGDGCQKKEIKTNLFKGNVYAEYRTSSKRMADDLAELVIKSGFGVSYRVLKQKGNIVCFKNGNYKINTDCYYIDEKKCVNYQMKSIKVKEEKYNDIVYDISVKDNHTLLIKYGSSIAWNSNCHCFMTAVLDE